MSSETTTSKKKPTKGYLVPSRYKQAAKSVSQSSSREKSPQTRGSSSQKSENTPLQSTMVESSRYGSSKKFTSTPAIAGQHALPSINASTITNESVSLCAPRRKAKNEANLTVHKQALVKNKTRGPSSKDAVPSRSNQKTASEFNLANSLSTAELNILYGEYLQAQLLNSNAKEAAEKRSKYFSEKIHQIWNLMMELMVKNAKLYRELCTVSYLNLLHQHLHTQEEMLLPVLEMIPDFENQYESIAKAVDIIRHKLEIKNMSLPEDGSEEEVLKLLQKISNVVKSMDKSEDIISGAEVTNTFLQQGKVISNEINRGTHLLSEANDLLLEETMLKLTLPNEL